MVIHTIHQKFLPIISTATTILVVIFVFGSELGAITEITGRSVQNHYFGGTSIARVSALGIVKIDGVLMVTNGKKTTEN